MSGIAPIADVRRRDQRVRFVPIGDLVHLALNEAAANCGYLVGYSITLPF